MFTIKDIIINPVFISIILTCLILLVIYFNNKSQKKQKIKYKILFVYIFLLICPIIWLFKYLIINQNNLSNVDNKMIGGQNIINEENINESISYVSESIKKPIKDIKNSKMSKIILADW